MKKLLLLFYLIFTLIIVNAQETSYVCAGHTATLTASCTGATNPTITWTSPTNVITTAESVTTSQAGVWIWTCTDGGCTSTGTHTLVLESDPTPSLTINASDICLNVSQNISASSVPAGYTIDWDFGSGSTPSTSGNINENVTYTSTGTKTITLTLTRVFNGTSNGCSSTCEWVKTKTITVSEISGNSSCITN